MSLLQLRGPSKPQHAKLTNHPIVSESYLLALNVENPFELPPMGSRTQDEVDTEMSAAWLDSGSWGRSVVKSHGPPGFHAKLTRTWNVPFSAPSFLTGSGAVISLDGGKAKVLYMSTSPWSNVQSRCTAESCHMEVSTKAPFKGLKAFFYTRVKSLHCCGSSCFRPRSFGGPSGFSGRGFERLG